MQEQNRNFFYKVKLDEQHHIKHAFWVDARSRAAYEYFSNVVSFDMTYLTNRYDTTIIYFKLIICTLVFACV
ncbi:hypothetical protein AHAS_Ahas14G0180500 [Arachis hypogaea]